MGVVFVDEFTGIEGGPLGGNVGLSARWPGTNGHGWRRKTGGWRRRRGRHNELPDEVRLGWRWMVVANSVAPAIRDSGGGRYGVKRGEMVVGSGSGSSRGH